ncbi:Uncharacterized protein TCM_017434 [Theobroma cacao]|uniref:Secreted protein n=1 Tax=Theobroma cacao TaxID=3641 RepID=A0A061EDM0_THECC|nr:Uncharacterized protein TCM_017434 [Theobroma cacao]
MLFQKISLLVLVLALQSQQFWNFLCHYRLLVTRCNKVTGWVGGGLGCIPEGDQIVIVTLFHLSSKQIISILLEVSKCEALFDVSSKLMN